LIKIDLFISNYKRNNKKWLRNRQSEKRMAKNILVTGAGGIGGVNFIRALRSTKQDFVIVGTDFNPYYIQFGDLDFRYKSPKHLDSNFIPFLINIIRNHKIDFLHPQPSSEALVVAQNRHDIPTRTFLPESNIISNDKLETQKILSSNGIEVAKTITITKSDEIKSSFDSLSQNKPLWIRAKSGAGGNLSLLCNSYVEAELWINLWVKRGKAQFSDFMIQEFLPGRNIAWDSLWHNGKFIASFTRERIEYPFKHISPSGITGTPTVSKIIVDPKINEYCTKAVLSFDKKPHGNYAVDLKGNIDGKLYVTEIDSGKFHTTTPLWGFISTRILKQNIKYNLPYTYVNLGLESIQDVESLGYDIYPEGLYLLRHIDCGVWLWRENGYKEQVL